MKLTSHPEDMVVYIDKDSNLYVITDFYSLSKNFISDKVGSFEIKEGVLFYTYFPSPKVKILMAVHDLKTFNKSEVLKDFQNYSLDLD